MAEGPGKSSGPAKESPTEAHPPSPEVVPRDRRLDTYEELQEDQMGKEMARRAGIKGS
jgi:hypothetical protein